MLLELFPVALSDLSELVSSFKCFLFSIHEVFATICGKSARD